MMHDSPIACYVRSRRDTCSSGNKRPGWD